MLHLVSIVVQNIHAPDVFKSPKETYDAPEIFWWWKQMILCQPQHFSERNSSFIGTFQKQG